MYILGADVHFSGLPWDIWDYWEQGSLEGCRDCLKKVGLEMCEAGLLSARISSCCSSIPQHSPEDMKAPPGSHQLAPCNMQSSVHLSVTLNILVLDSSYNCGVHELVIIQHPLLRVF